MKLIPGVDGHDDSDLLGVSREFLVHPRRRDEQDIGVEKHIRSYV